MKFFALLAIFCMLSVVHAAPIVYTDEAAFLSAVPATSLTTETFTADTGGLIPVVDPGTSFQVADDSLKFTVDKQFHLTNFIHRSVQFTSFGARFCQVPQGTFIAFANANFLSSRLDPLDSDFFLGVVSDVPFDLFSLTHNTGSYSIAVAYYTLVPEPSSVLMLLISGILILPSLVRGPLR